MRITSRVAGLALQDGAIMIAPGYKDRHHCCFDDFTTLHFPDGELADGRVQDSAAVSAALTRWRRRFRGRLQLRVALPAPLYLQQRIRLPESRMVQASVVPLIDTYLARTFPGRCQDLIYDYCMLPGEIVLTTVHRAVREVWEMLAAKMGARLTVLDLIPCAMRCFAHARGVPAQDWLLFSQGNSICWQAGTSHPALSGQAEPDLPSLSDALTLQGFDNAQASLCCLHDTALLPVAWQHECEQYSVTEPDTVPAGYAAAAGMVLRGEDRL